MAKKCQYDLSKLKYQRYLVADNLPFSRNGGGKNLCRWCGGIVPKPRIKWCSKDCVDEYLLRADGSVLTSKTYKRDQGICVDCGLDTKAIKELMRILRTEHERKLGRWYLDKIDVKYDEHYNLWQAHHVIAVKDGGGCCGLDNIVTVCLACHYKRHTKPKPVIIDNQLTLY